MKRCLAVLLITLPFSLTGLAESTYTWSSTACPQCQSTIVYQAWFPDGAPLIAEGMAGANTGALVALSLHNDTLVVSLGLRISHEPALTVALRESVTLEADSATPMVLYALDPPDPRFGRGNFEKDDVAVVRRLNTRLLTLRPFAPVSGFLFFPWDRRASHVVVVVKIGSEVLRFPFVQDARSPARFVDPAQAAPVMPAPNHHAEPTKGASGCAKNISFAVAEDGRLLAGAPDFAGRWLQKHGAQYPGLCFSQTPDLSIANYLVAIAPAETDFLRFSPLVRGDRHAADWDYHYAAGTATVTSTTTFVALPWADKTRSLCAFTYDQRGRVVSRRRRSVTTRRTSGSAIDLGVNITAAVVARNLKERLLEDAILDITRSNAAPVLTP